MAIKVTIRHGIDVVLPGAPEQRIAETPRIGAVGLLGADLPGIRPHLHVEEGSRVSVGDILFSDRARPEIGFPAPLSGRVRSIELGARRMLSSVVIEADETAAAPVAGPADDSSETALRQTLLSRGLWPAFRTRPFDRIPAPDARPAAIFIRVIDTHPLTADPRVVLSDRMDEFRRGARALTRLTEGPVYACQSPGPDLAADIEGLTGAFFRGPHPAGLSTTHVMELVPAHAFEPVWTISYQDVAAIGHLLETGLYDPRRVVALAGPRIAQPHLLRTVIGARLRDLTQDRVTPGAVPARVLSGSVLSGREAAYLGRYNTQVTVLDAATPPRRSALSRVLDRMVAAPAPKPIVPSELLENALPPGIPVVPLLRALSVGDAETVRRLGGDMLVEEDLALASSLCTSQADYAALLRRVLDELMEDE